MVQQQKPPSNGLIAGLGCFGLMCIIFGLAFWAGVGYGIYRIVNG